MGPGAAEVLIIAGDMAPAKAGLYRKQFEQLCTWYDQVLYVPGNHDYYGRVSHYAVDIMFSELEDEFPNLHVFREGHEFFEYKGQRFIGSMLGYRVSEELKAAWGLIADSGQIADISWVFKHNVDFTQLLWDNLKSTDIVITHHLPSNESTPDIWKDSPSQPFFVHDLESLISSAQPKLWIHGHTHTACDYLLANTRVYCNPVGYPGEHVDLERVKALAILEV